MSFLDKIRAAQPTSDRVLDPVCGMRIDPAHAAGTSVRDGKTVHFCSLGCKAKFDARP